MPVFSRRNRSDREAQRELGREFARAWAKHYPGGALSEPDVTRGQEEVWREAIAGQWLREHQRSGVSANEYLEQLKTPTWEKRLSAADLSDIPLDMRIGSPRDSSDREVERFARDGVLIASTNCGVVYRVAFAPVLPPGETPLALRFVFAASAPDPRGDQPPELPTMEGAWLLVTDWGLRWHYMVDGVPGFPATPTLPSPAGTRHAAYGEIQAVDTGTRVPGKELRPPMDLLTVFHGSADGPSLHIFGVVEDESNPSLFSGIRDRLPRPTG
jgi:hypothetical protein